MATLAEVSLDAAERDAVDRVVDSFQAELGDDLLAVWLYGSRARGEPPHDESDVDLLVITRRGAEHSQVVDITHRALAEHGTLAVRFSAKVFRPQEIAYGRAIERFFVQAVDRDKVVLYGSGGEDWRSEASPFGESGVRKRTEELLTQARAELEAAGRDAAHDDRATINHAYYSMLNAARAALSEADRYTRTHGGTWDLFHAHFAKTGRIELELARRASAAQEVRERSVYGHFDENDVMWQPDPGQGEAVLRDAERFLQAVERELGAR